MKRILLALTVLPFAATLLAQNCPERTFGTFLGIGDDTMFAIQPIGFVFPFAGATYTDVHICTNGYFFLSNGGVPAPAAGDFTATTAELAAQSPRICALWHDLNVTAANNGGVYIAGSATQCTITWNNIVNYGLTTPFLMQVQLFPSGEVKMFFGEGATNNSTFNYAAGQGITGVSPGLGAVLPAASNLAASSNTPDNLLYEHWAWQGTFDLPLKGLHLIPTNPGWVWVTTPWSGCAAAHDQGLGCVHAADSFYETMAPSAFDLANTSWRLVRTTSGYVATTASANYVTPSATATIVANADDIVTTVALAQAMPVPGGTTASLSISSNGNVALSATGNGGGFAPDAGLFLAFAQTSVAAAWHDYNPALAGSGKIKFEQQGSTAYVTWDGVYSYLTSQADTFQYQLDLTTGDVTVVYGTMATGANDYLVGYSRGGASPRTIETDVSAALATPLALADVGVQGLTLTTNGLPLIGNAGFGYAISRIPSVSPVGVMMFGDQATPGIDLTFLGMPGCRGYTNANLASLTFLAAQPAGTGSQLLPIPNNTALIGAAITAQAIAFSLATPLNLVSSNGTAIEVGL